MKWCRTFWCFLAIVGAISALLIYAFLTRARQHVTIGYGGAGTANAMVFGPETNMLDEPAEPTATNTPIPGWSVTLNDKNCQWFHVQYLPEYDNVLIMKSDSVKGEIKLTSPKFKVQSDMKFQAKTFFKMEDDFKGNVSLCISLDRRQGNHIETIDEYVVKQPELKRRDNWILAQKTFDLPQDAESIQFQIRCKFSGTVIARDISLVRKTE